MLDMNYYSYSHADIDVEIGLELKNRKYHMSYAISVGGRGLCMSLTSATDRVNFSVV